MFKVAIKNKTNCIFDFLSDDCCHQQINKSWKFVLDFESIAKNSYPVSIIKKYHAIDMHATNIAANVSDIRKSHSFSCYPATAKPNIDSRTGNVLSVLDKLILARVLSFKDEQLIDYILSRYEELEEIEYTCMKARKEFDETNQLFLELFTDPESEEEEKFLCLFIRKKHYEDDIMERIKKARTAIRINPIIKQGTVHLTTDFQPPR